VSRPPVSRARLVRANNPSPMTLEGTNTWVLVEPARTTGTAPCQALVVDPGPADVEHLQAILSAARDVGAADVGLIVLTHGHPDHAEGATAFAELTGAPIRAADPALCSAAEPLVDGERLVLDGLLLDVLATPGHTADSVCLLLAADRALLTGDTLLGRGSTVVAYPEGRLADYFESLRILRALVDERQVRVVLPGHGPVRGDPVALLDGYVAHRLERLEQVRAAVAAGAPNTDAVLRTVYGGVDETLLHAARWSLLAQLAYLRENGEPVTKDVAT
jgi:glyoxylase-like metal-dependent hydrolase (beta-lactamase superfamily II)